MLKNTENSYGTIAKLLHWIIAAMIITLLSVGYYMTDLPNSPDKFKIYDYHKITGFTVLVLMIIRLVWRLCNQVPKDLDNIPHWQRIAADLNIKVLYFLGIAMPLSGILMTLYGGRSIDLLGLFTIKAFETNKKLSSLAWEFHEAFAVLLIALISLHILAALYHHFIRKDNIFKKMLWGSKT